MKVAKKKQHLISLAVLGLLLLLATPATTFAQGRWRGQNREWNSRRWNTRQWNNGQWNNSFRRWRFVNRHHDRDGRWDGRGSGRVRFFTQFRNRDRDDWVWRNRFQRRNFDNRWNNQRRFVRRYNW